MIKNKKRGVFILLVMLCMVLACFVGCGTIDAPSGGEGDNPQGGDRLPSVSASGVTISNDGSSFWVSWNAVEGANSYVVKSGSASLTTEVPLVDLATASGFTVPTGGEKITVTIIAKGDGYKDSSPTSITYEEGKQVRSPEIISFKNGMITWKEDSNAKKYIVKINGETAAETTANTHNISSLSSNARIDITADSGSSSATLSVMYNADSKKLSVMPISEYTLSGDIIKWSAVGGAIGYKVVDLDFNAYDVDTPHYIMSIRNIVYGVYPVMPATAVVGSAEVAPVDIRYLQGSGTASDPYIIKTPFDLRTIDYYELKSYEAGAKAKNYYKIASDMDYNTVSALESDSNIFTLRKPFFGVLDGDGKTLSGISVHYNNGYWALFDFIAAGATVKNIKFDNPVINNGVRDQWFIDPAIAMVAYRNYGEVSAITLSNAKFNVTSGSAAGLVIHNYGTVSGCTVN
ncbi:MAG: hypothetical protein K2L88_02990, partial [Clostridiales bacterium]|nr:hypothetical protein [Clostridiales bacterium]